MSVTWALLFLFSVTVILSTSGVGHFVGAGVLDRLELRVALHRQRAGRLDLADHERATRRRRVVGRVLVQRGARRHRCGEHQPEHILEGAVRLGQLNGDVTGVVVGLDAADRSRLAVGVILGADDDVEEHRAAGVGLEQPLDGVGEVGCLDRRSVGVLHVRPKLELVGLAVGRDVGHVLGQPGTTWVPVLALGVLVGQQGGVDVPEHLPPLEGVGQLRVDVVGERGQRDVDVATARHHPRRLRPCRLPHAATPNAASGVMQTMATTLRSVFISLPMTRMWADSPKAVRL